MILLTQGAGTHNILSPLTLGLHFLTPLITCGRCRPDENRGCQHRENWVRENEVGDEPISTEEG